MNLHFQVYSSVQYVHIYRYLYMYMHTMIESFSGKITIKGKVGHLLTSQYIFLIFLKPPRDNLSDLVAEHHHFGLQNLHRDPGRDRPTIEQRQRIEWQVGSPNEKRKFHLYSDGVRWSKPHSFRTPSHDIMTTSVAVLKSRTRITPTMHLPNLTGVGLFCPSKRASKWKNRFSQQKKLETLW